MTIPVDDGFTLVETVPPEEGEKKEFDIIPDDTILGAVVVKSEKAVKPYKDDDGNPIIKVEFSFKVTDEGEYRNRRVWGETPTTFTTHPDCKLRAWVQEALAVAELPKDFTFNLADLNDQPVRVVVGVRSWTDKSTGNLQERNYVKDVIRDRDHAEAVASAVPEEEPF